MLAQCTVVGACVICIGVSNWRRSPHCAVVRPSNGCLRTASRDGCDVGNGGGGMELELADAAVSEVVGAGEALVVLF